jgi:hypothetical protein
MGLLTFRDSEPINRLLLTLLYALGGAGLGCAFGFMAAASWSTKLGR